MEMQLGFKEKKTYPKFTYCNSFEYHNVIAINEGQNYHVTIIVCFFSHLQVYVLVSMLHIFTPKHKIHSALKQKHEEEERNKRQSTT